MSASSKASGGNKKKPEAQVFNEPFNDEKGSTIVGITKGGKYVHAKRDQKGYFYIVFYPGGELPDYLKGRWTNYIDVLHQAHTYIKGEF